MLRLQSPLHFPVLAIMAALTVVFISACIASVLASQNSVSLNSILFDGDYEFFDLTHPFDEHTVYWPGTQKFIFTNKIADESNGYWYATNEFAAGEHGGTHIDAPVHFSRTGKHVGDLPLEKLIVPMIIADVSSQVSGNPKFVLTKQDLNFMLNDNMGKPCVILFKFGWSKYFNNKTEYLGLNEKDNTLNFPGLSAEVAEWITTAYKNVVGIGVDVASLDPGSSTDFPVHQINSKAGIYNIENINFNDKNKNIPEYGCTALIMPMKIAIGTGAPLRLVAICPKKT